MDLSDICELVVVGMFRRLNVFVKDAGGEVSGDWIANLRYSMLASGNTGPVSGTFVRSRPAVKNFDSPPVTMITLTSELSFAQVKASISSRRSCTLKALALGLL